jgi:hypothetical protein
MIEAVVQDRQVRGDFVREERLRARKTSWLTVVKLHV